MTSPSDQALAEDVSSAARGDRDAFARLVVATDGLALALLLAGATDPATARRALELLYQEVWEGLGRLGQPDAFLPWLRRVARRRARRLAEGGGPAAPAGAVREVLAALAALPAELHEPALLYALEGHSAAQVGRLLGLPDAEAHARVDRARAVLGEIGVARLGEALAAFAPGGDLVASVLERLPARPPAGAAPGAGGGLPTALTALQGMMAGVAVALLVLTLAGLAWRACGPPVRPDTPAAGAPRQGPAGGAVR